MIGFIRGLLAEKGDGYITVDVNGVGYEVFVPANSSAYLAAEGSEVMVYTYMSVKEDGVSLYGFSRKGELEAFKKLITVNGVGAKAGISIMSAFPLSQLQQTIAFEDAKSLTKANGIGKKTAERIVLELKDKFSVEGRDTEDTNAPAAEEISGPENARGEAVAALMALGYTRAEAAGAVRSVKDSELTAEEYIRLALKKLF
ncbi:MAG TPA: Holliday junction branch migration protein RuvA [Candidatus Copromorpha excrementigallinarum]|uniref:Holliday junction branch migration complex subunit RuvA n=1 Tax=Candidatus Allocopromorpha excrementigallinarum TaxID=2840742 RepID=A0A9D1L7B5_9FIRM|nr:Holliday junction branch migration protein RuvA [Candidatus Copromorpha excrementigallinarum]